MTIWLPWILLALINPWIEDFFYPGLQLENTKEWKNWLSILFSLSIFSLIHAVFGINSEVNSGITVIISTFVIGLIWSVAFKKTESLRWLIFAHFLVDFFSLSVPAFLDLFEASKF